MQEPTFDELRSAIETALRHAQHYFVGGVKRELYLYREDEQRIAQLLRRSPTLDRHFDSQKSRLCDMPVPGVCSLLVESADRHSIDATARVLADFLRTGTFPVTKVFLVKGPKIQEPIQLDKDSRLVPYEQVAHVAEKFAADSPSPVRIWFDAATDACGLIITAAVRPGSALTSIPPPEARRELYRGVARFGPGPLCSLLGLVTRRAFYPFYDATIVDEINSDTLPMARTEAGSGAMTRVEFSVFPNSEVLAPEDLDQDELASLVSALAEAPDNVVKLLAIPLRRLNMALSRFEHSDRCIDVCIALEALGGGKKWPQRLAWLYAQKTEADLKAVRTKIGKFYSHRGEIVHQGKTSHESELLKVATSVLIECIKWIARERRIPNWTTEVGA